MDPSSAKFFHYAVTVDQKDLDALGHVNNTVYLRWVQEAAEAHWKHLSNETINKKYFWVVMRHEIDYFHPALPANEIIVTTWVGNHTGAKSERHTIVTLAGSEKKLAAAITTWCLVDAVTRRPKRIDTGILSLF